MASSVPVLLRLRFLGPQDRARDFYMSTKRNSKGELTASDYMSYMERGAHDGETMDRLDGKPSKTFGTSSLFDGDGILSDKAKRELRKELRDLRETECSPGDLVVSLDEGFAPERWNDWQDAQGALRRAMPNVLRLWGFNPETVRWCAAYHANTGNRHVHVLFFERQPGSFRGDGTERKWHTPWVPKERLAMARGEFAKDIQSADSRIEAARRALRQGFRPAAMIQSPEVRENREFRVLLKAVYEALPAQKPARIAYGNQGQGWDKVRSAADRAAEWLIGSDGGLSEAYAEVRQRLSEADRKTEESVGDPKKAREYLMEEKVLADLRRRLGNPLVLYVAQAKYGNWGRFKSPLPGGGKARAAAALRREKPKKRMLFGNAPAFRQAFRENGLREFDELMRSLESEDYRRRIADWLDREAQG